jgi:hypothetical protein
VLHPEVREWLHEIRKTDRLTAALIGQARPRSGSCSLSILPDRWFCWWPATSPETGEAGTRWQSRLRKPATPSTWLR